MVKAYGYWLPILLNILFVTVIYCVKITKISIPDYHVVDKNESTKSLVLDCEYKIDPNETGFVVKWSFRDDIIYQWIFGRKPHIMQAYMKGKIDTTYEASSDPAHKYRALALINPTWNSTGIYTCSAESFELDDRKSSFLQIIDISKSSVEISRNVVNDVEEISCIATNFYPQPIVNLSLNDNPLPKKANKVQLPESGLFDVTAIATSSILDKESDTQIICSLYFPRTNYTIRKLLVDSGSNRVSKFPSISIFSTIFTLILTIFFYRSI